MLCIVCFAHPFHLNPVATLTLWNAKVVVCACVMVHDKSVRSRPVREWRRVHGPASVTSQLSSRQYRLDHQHDSIICDTITTRTSVPLPRGSCPQVVWLNNNIRHGKPISKLRIVI